VTAGDARHGRRDNGLVAAEYASAGDVDPRVGEHLLEVLALEGIAAYLRPTTDLHPVTRSSTLPNRPTDRLYVDRQHLGTARGYVDSLAADAAGRPVADRRDAEGRRGAAAPDESGGPASARDVEAEWAKIIASYDTEVDEPSRSWPSAEELPAGPPDRDSDGAAHGDSDGTGAGPTPAPPLGGWSLPRAAPVDQPSLLDGLDTFGADLTDEDDEGYTPPAPPPLPRPSLPTVLGVVGVVGGLIVFLRPDLLPMAESTALLAGFAAIVAGFVTLVWRLRPGDDGDDDPDNGAKV